MDARGGRWIRLGRDGGWCGWCTERDGIRGYGFGFVFVFVFGVGVGGRVRPGAGGYVESDAKQPPARVCHQQPLPPTLSPTLPPTLSPTLFPTLSSPRPWCNLRAEVGRSACYALPRASFHGGCIQPKVIHSVGGVAGYIPCACFATLAVGVCLPARCGCLQQSRKSPGMICSERGRRLPRWTTRFLS